MEQYGLDAKEWAGKLEGIARRLDADFEEDVDEPTELCVIGSAACMFDGMIRTSMDLDVWRPASRFDEQQLRSAVEAEGLLFNPTIETPDRPYIQIVDPGIVQTGEFDSVCPLGSYWTCLDIVRPPVENIIVSKLIRAEPKDIEDIMHLATRHAPDFQKIRDLIADLPHDHKWRAEENSVYLEIMEPPRRGIRQ